jgi:lipoate---protein ligase
MGVYLFNHLTDLTYLTDPNLTDPMLLLDLTLPTPAENLACDEALLDFFEEHGGDGVLRFWEPKDYFVVVGYANQVQKEVNVTACDAEGIPILRRCSGGGTVLQGPGCLNYSLVLKIDEGGPLASITAANRSIMERNRKAIEGEIGDRRSEIGIEIRGCTDLALATRHSSPGTQLKFSGNAQRRKKNFLLFHGTFLLNFDIALIDKFLRMPSKEPEYREGRSHTDFLTNVKLEAGAVKRRLIEAWSANGDLPAGRWRSQVALLARDRYVTKEWNFKF